jgi:hypothetical protein
LNGRYPPSSPVAVPCGRQVMGIWMIVRTGRGEAGRRGPEPHGSPLFRVSGTAQHPLLLPRPTGRAHHPNDHFTLACSGQGDGRDEPVPRLASLLHAFAVAASVVGEVAAWKVAARFRQVHRCPRAVARLRPEPRRRSCGLRAARASWRTSKRRRGRGRSDPAPCVVVGVRIRLATSA